MKLHEILIEDWESSDLAQDISPQFNRAINRQRQQPNHKYVGSGSMAYVGKTDTQHEMDRVSRTAASNEGGSVYLKYIASHPELHNNPFLPRVLAKPTGRNYVTYQVERLVPFDAPKIYDNILLLTSLWEQYFTTPVPPTTTGYNAVGEELVETLQRVIMEHLPADTIHDSNLLQAITLIRQLSDSKTAGYADVDIHSGNIMWRITGNMPQLVITDPLV